MASTVDTTSAVGPLRFPVFRLLWGSWVAAALTMWMNDVAAAWLMTSLAPTPLWVAMVQTAATLPVFLLALPSGALADILDRRRVLIGTQLWMATIACIMCTAVLAGWMSPPLLLLLTFCNGIGLAMRWPVFVALIPEVLPRQQLSQGMALTGVAMNGSRIAGPLVAGAIIASAGSAWVFVLGATLSVASAFTVMRWRHQPAESRLRREPLLSAMRVGLQFMRQSRRMHGIMLRTALIFFHSTAIISLLPLVARALPGGNSATFTLLLASMGAGAVFSALNMPRVRRRFPLPRLILFGAMLMAVCVGAMAYAPNLAVAVPVMFVTGMAWIASANSLTLSAQLALPNWVRARGMAIYQMTMMGGSAAGAATWGQVATSLDIHQALLISAVSSVVLMVLAYRLVREPATEEDLTPSSRVAKVPDVPEPSHPGRVLVHIEYRIDPARESEFRQVMERTRRSRLAQGALEWQLVQDLAEPARWVEHILDESWTEHLRRFDRLTAADAQLREQRLQLHVGAESPEVTRYRVADESYPLPDTA